MEAKNQKNKVIAFIDIGTNSVRLLIVRINPNQSYTLLKSEKEVVRLGESEFSSHNLLHSEAIKRTVLVCKRFVELCRTYGATRIIALATSATREAKNRQEFLKKLRTEAGLEAKVISGKEEARLIYLGLSSGAHIGKRRAVFIDIGGGSTELAVGDQFHFTYLDSLEVGALRLTSLFGQEASAEPMSKEKYAKMKLQARNVMQRAIRHLKADGPKLAYGSSGTIVNLAEMAAKLNKKKNGSRDLTLSYKDLRKLASELRPLALEERRNFPGMNPERADIIIGGAAILETFMGDVGIKEIQASNRGLLYGMLADHLSKTKGFSHFRDLSVRERSVLQLGRSFNIDEKHAEAVTSIAIQLFKSGAKTGLHALSEKEAELLKYASFLHDVGDFISVRNHQHHSYYIIKNVELLGFDDEEINIMANTVRFHGKKPPKKKDLEEDLVDARSQNTATVLSGILRVAENLDRSCMGHVKKAAFSRVDRSSATLYLLTDGGCELELWGVKSNADAFEKTFKKKLKISTKTRKPKTR